MVAAAGSQGLPSRNPRRRPVAVRFDHERSSSDGGAVPVVIADRALGLTAAFADCLRDRRQPSEVLHSLADMLGQRIYGLACGCEDCNDAGRLGGDPVFKLPLGRDPWQGRDLPSRPTLSRFENAGTADAPSALSAVPARCVVRRRHERRPETRIVELDFDPTCEPTHGGRQLALCNGFYDTHCYLPCYLPLVGAVRFDDERERHLVAALLRSGTAAAAEGLLPLLDRLLPLLREFFPRATLRLRLDAGFQGDELLAYGEREGLEYVACLQKNAVPERRAAPLRAAVEARRAPGGIPGTDPGGEGAAPGDPPGAVAGEVRAAGSRHAGGPAGPAVRAVRLPGGPPVAGAAGDRQGGRERVSRARPAVAPALRGDQRGRQPAAPLRADPLPAGRRGEPHQGAQARDADGPRQLHELRGEPVPRAARGGGLRDHAGTALAGTGHAAAEAPGGRVAPRPAEAGGAGRGHGEADRAASAADGTVPGRLGGGGAGLGAAPI